MLPQNLELVRSTIRTACQRVGRAPSSVSLVAVTKTVPVELIQQAIALGVTDIGENRVQEARAKRLALGSRLEAVGKSGLEPSALSLQPIRWHMVGHLQRNKAKDAVELFDVIHSVDSVELVRELERQLTKRTQDPRLPGPPTALAGAGKTQEKKIEVFVQVNVSGEATKFGCRSEEAETLAHAVLGCEHLRLAGLMTIPPFSDNPEDARPHFRRLRELRDALQRSLHSALRTLNSALRLSMGMSHDFEVAIEEGADVVRVGTAIFGDRRPET